MMSPDTAQRLIELVIEVQLAEPSRAALFELESLLESPDARRFYIELINVQGHLEALHTHCDLKEAGEHLDAAEILAILGQAEDAAPDYYVASQDPRLLDLDRGGVDVPDRLTLHQTASALAYFVRQQITPRLVVMSSVAAVLLLGFTIFLVLQSGNTSLPLAPTDLVQRPVEVEQPDSSGIIKAPVATLTAQHDAQWQAGSGTNLPDVGDTLLAGQRLTLTAGYAEITTSRGAIAILEAPATLELLDNDNAIRLHAGKLVGLCHTESSKGFVVRTAYADITDLGTEFGVQATPVGLTTTVFVGEVQLNTSDEPSHTIRGHQTAGVTLTDGTTQVDVVDATADQFAATYTRRLPRSPLVTAVRLHDAAGMQAEVAPQSFYESAKLYSDRSYLAMPYMDQALPQALLGGDVVQMPITDAPRQAYSSPTMGVEVTLAQPAQVYVLVPPNALTQDWLVRDYERTEMAVVLGWSNPQSTISREATRSRVCQVWKRKQPVRGTAMIAGPLKEDSTGMYTLVVTPLPQPIVSHSGQPETSP